MHRLTAATLVLGTGLLLTMQARAQAAQETTPPKTGHEIQPTHIVVPGTSGPVKVLLLPSWGTTSGWEDLKTQWPSYGVVPISIDDTTYIDNSFTYGDLVSSGADVIVLSDPAGGFQQYTSDEVKAVQSYAKLGHTVLGTYAVFEWSTTDNRALMPVFGLNATLTYNGQLSISNLFTQDVSRNCLFNNLPSSWQSDGYPYTQYPTGTTVWTHNSLDLAFLIADSDSDAGIVSVYNGGRYAGIYISNYPEYYGGTYDLQLLYNAVTCFAQKGQ